MEMRPLFTSERERRLWFWTLAVLVAIYSTLGLGGTLAGVLRDRGLLNASFALGAPLLLLIIVTQGLKKRPGGVEIIIALGVAVVYFMVFVRMGIPEGERHHLIEYVLVAVLIYQVLTEHLRNGRRVPAPAALAVAVTALLGWLDEGIQAITPDRVYDVRDVGFNALAGLMAIGVILALAWVRRRGG